MQKWPVVSLPLCAAAAAIGLLPAVVAAAGPANPISDFAAFHRAGTWVADGRPGSLYPLLSFGSSPGPGDTFKGFLNPPPVAALFAPLGTLSLRTASLVFLALNVAVLSWLLAICGKWLLRQGLSGRAVACISLLLVASPPVTTSLATGTMSIFMAGVLVGVIARDRHGDQWATGAVLALLSIKPQYAVIPVVFLAARGRWRTVTTCGVVTMALSVMSLPFTGIEPWQQYPEFLGQYAERLDLYGKTINPSDLWLPRQMLGLRGLFVRILGVNHIAVINVLGTVAVAAGIAGAVAVGLAGRKGAREPRTGTDLLRWETGLWAPVLVLAVATSQHANIGDGTLVLLAAVVFGGTHLTSILPGRTGGPTVALLGALYLAFMVGSPAAHTPTLPWSAIAVVTMFGLTVASLRHGERAIAT
jgi:Glycosyltransferase family 87